jgi:exodeoxyribonuclease VII small subunit
LVCSLLPVSTAGFNGLKKPRTRKSADVTATEPAGSDGPTLAPDTIDRLSFDEAFAELQRVVADLETGGQPLETSIALYERGVALHERCSRLLADADLRVKRLVERAAGALEALDVRRDEAIEPPES